MHSRQSPCQSVDEDQLLADPQPALDNLRLDTLQLGIALQQRLQARGILVPKPLPQRDRMLGGFELSLGRGLRLAGVAAGELGVKVENRLAEDFGKPGTLARAEFRLGQPFQLVADRFVVLGDI